MAATPVKALLRVRMNESDAHYPGSLIAGGKLMQFFGDVATELLIKHDGDCGLFRAYDMVEFLAPVHAGDYLEIEGEITRVGNTSRAMSFVVRKVIELEPGVAPSAAKVLKEPVIVAKASGTCVVPKELQRKAH